MRILMFADYPHGSMIKGPSVHTLALAEGLRDREDIELCIVDFKGRSAKRESLRVADNIQVNIVPVQFPLTYYNILTGYRAYANEINSFKPDLVHFFDSHQVNALRRTGQIPHVLTVHGHFFNEHGLVSQSLKRRLSRSTYFKESFSGLERADNLILLSRYSSNEVHPYTRARHHFLSQPILNEIYALPRNVDPSTVLSVGNIARVKGTDRLVEAHAFFPKGTRTLIAGSIRDKTFYNELTRTIEKQNIEGIHFLGALERSGIYHALSTASVVACPSRLENMPYALLEALAAGIPCVSFDVGGIGEFLTDGVNGFLPGDQQGFVKAITTLIEDEPLRHKMSNNARISVQGNRSGPVCEELAKIYREILN